MKPRDRVFHYPLGEHARGWIEWGMGRAPPLEASPDFIQGYRDARDHFLSVATACDCLELVRGPFAPLIA